MSTTGQNAQPFWPRWQNGVDFASSSICITLTSSVQTAGSWPRCGIFRLFCAASF